MGRQWLAHCGAAFRPELEAALKRRHPDARVVFVDQGADLRTLVGTMASRSVSVAVGSGGDLEAINLAAAVVADGHARWVEVYCQDPSGSLRSRAARAGVAAVVATASGRGAQGAALSQGAMVGEQLTARTTATSAANQGAQVPAPGMTSNQGAQAPALGAQGAAVAGSARGGQSTAGAPAPSANATVGTSLPAGADALAWKGEEQPAKGASRDHAFQTAGIGASRPVGTSKSAGASGAPTASGTSAAAGASTAAGAPAVSGAPTASGAAGASPQRAGTPGQRLLEGEGPVLVVASARGGVGKSSIAAVCALEAASWGMDVALVDLDLAFGGLFGFFGRDAGADLTSLAQDCSAEALGRLGVPVADGVTLYGPCARPEYAETVSPLTERLLAHLKQRHDLVIVDAPTAWNDATAQAAQCCDRLALVADDRAGAVGSLARATALAGRLGVARTRLVRLMNRCDPKRRDEGFVARASQGLEGGPVHRILDGGFDVAELLGTGHAQELVALDEDFSRSCRSAVAKTLADLGRLPDVREAEEARDLVVTRRSGLFRFAKEAV